MRNEVKGMADWRHMAAIVKDVLAVEAVTDDAIAASARLLERTARARSAMNIPAPAAQPIYRELGQIIMSHLEGQTAIAAAHKRLRVLADRMSQDPTGWGTDESCPYAATDESVPHIRAA